MNIKKVATALLVVSLLGGCASMGNEALRHETENTMQKKIIEGKTTKSEIKAMFGSPMNTAFTDGGYEVATYEFSNVKADAINYVPIVGMFGGTMSGKKKELVIMYDKNDVVKRYSMSESDVKQKTGLFNQ